MGNPHAGATQTLYAPTASAETGNVRVSVLLDEAFSPYEITCFRAKYKFSVEDLTKYSPGTKYNTAIPVDPAQRTWANNTKLILNEYALGYTALSEEKNPDEVISFELKYSDEELDQIGTSDTDLKTYLKEARAQFGAGQLDPYSDADWNAYLKAVESLGAEAWTKAAQSAYDRFMGN